jgi:hypothetical protein
MNAFSLGREGGPPAPSDALGLNFARRVRCRHFAIELIVG